MDDLLADFVAETREMLEAISGEIVMWEGDPADRARLDTIFRFVHTVKGNCGFFDFPRLERLSHAAEDALAECRAGRREADSDLVSAVLAIIDRIGDMNCAIGAGEEFPGGGDEELIAALAAHDEVAPVAQRPPTQCQSHHPAGAGQAAHNPSRATTVQRSIRLPVELLDEVMKGVSDMVLARNDLARRLRDSGEQPTIDGPFERLSTILADVRTAITRMRMQRLEHLFGSLPRLVRDLSMELGKQVMVDFEGGEVELDREMVEMIRDPLTHIIRNAIDHGIETPAERIGKGKREIGLLRFSARQSGNQIALTVTDDGRGIDPARLSAKAVEAGIVSQAEADAMSERQRQHLIFAPGLSTAEAVSAVSGRGVGMDVVRANLERIGGTIDVSSRPGEGTSLTLHLPLTLSIIAALTVEASGQRYAIPRSFVDEIAFGSAAHVDFSRVGERRLISFRGRRIPCLALGGILGTEDGATVNWSTKTLVIIRLANAELFALAVDRVHDHEDVVVKPVAPAIMATGLYAGTTLLDDGKPMMLLDLPRIAARHQLIGGARNPADTAGKETQIKPVNTTPVMLFIGLDGRRRGVRLDLVRRIDTVASEAVDMAGAQAQAVIDGRLISVTGHERGPMPDGRCRFLRLSDGHSDLAYAVREVCDVGEIGDEILPVATDGETEGVALVDGQPVPIVDGHRLFAAMGAPHSGDNPLTCRLPASNDWARSILEPLIEAAGYRIARGDNEEADVAFVLSDDAESPAGPARQLIRLRQEPHAPAGDDGSIYRYDREGLLSALRLIRRGRAA